MKKNVSLRMLLAGVILSGCSLAHKLSAQDRVSVHVAMGGSNIEVNGLGILDVADPYIRPVVQYMAGLRYEKSLSPHMSLVTGAQYASRGFGARESINVPVFGLDLPLGASLETRLNYVEAPVMLKYNFTESGVQPYVQAGASAAYALNGKITPRVDALISWKLPAIDINLENDLFNRWDVSALAGAGVSIPVNSYSSLNLEVNYRHSLNDMFLDNITDVRIKSHGVGAVIAYSLRF